MSLQAQIQDDLKTAMKERDRTRTGALRMAIAAIKNRAVEKGLGPQGDLDDDEVRKLLQTQVKQRAEAAEAFRGGDREDSAVKEEAEAEILSAYLPEPLSDDELSELADEAIAEVGATGMQDMGRVMGVAMDRVGTRADGSRVSAVVKDKLKKL